MLQKYSVQCQKGPFLCSACGLPWAIVLVVSFSGFVWGQVPLVQLSSDPFTNTDSQHATEIEPDTFAYGSTMVAAFQVGRRAQGASSDIGFATTTDGGATWTSGYLPGISRVENPDNPYDRANDPAVAYSAKHNVWLIATMPWSYAPKGERPPANIPAAVISRSVDGIHWDDPVPATPNMTSSDKPWIACDNWTSSPFYGNCYLEWDEPANNTYQLIRLATSSDGGLTWSAPVATPDQAGGIGGLPLPQPDGKVIVPYLTYFPKKRIRAFTSSDGGVSWSKSVTISRQFLHLEAAKLRNISEPSAEINKHGRVYVVWQDCRFRANCSANDIVMSSSKDGVNWKPVTRVPIDDVSSGVDHFLPGLAVDPTRFGSLTRLGLTYYYYSNTNCTAETCELNVGFISSKDEGTTWSEPIQLAGPMKVTWLPIMGCCGNAKPMLADYISTSYVNGKAFGVFMVAQPNVGTTYNQAMYTTAQGLTTPEEGPFRSSANDKPVTNPLLGADFESEETMLGRMGDSFSLWPELQLGSPNHTAEGDVLTAF